MYYSARKKNTIKEGIASKLESRTTLYTVLAVKKLLDGSKKLEGREAASPSAGRACGASWYWQQTSAKTKEKIILFWSPERRFTSVQKTTESFQIGKCEKKTSAWRT